MSQQSYQAVLLVPTTVPNFFIKRNLSQKGMNRIKLMQNCLDSLKYQGCIETVSFLILDVYFNYFLHYLYTRKILNCWTELVGAVVRRRHEHI